MTTALLSFCLSLSLGQAPEVPPGVGFLGQKDFKLPLMEKTSRRAEVREFKLYYSTEPDIGKTWDEAGIIRNEPGGPREDGFIFHAPADGQYWFQVTATDFKGKQDPENLLDFHKRPERVQKWIVHSLKPFVRITSAQRQGDDVVVAWEIQEPYPDWSTFRVEYQIQPSQQWIPVQTTPHHTGQARFQPGNLSPLTVKIHLRNRAKNDGHAVVEVSGSGVQPAFPGPGPSLGGSPLLAPPGSLGQGESSALPPPPGGLAPPPNFGMGREREREREREERASFDNPPPAPPPPQPPQPIGPRTTWGPPPGHENKYRPIAYSDSSVAPSAPSLPSRKPMPEARIVNTKEVTLEYELTKIGPSGVGSVDLWWTRNDGQSWERYADDPEAKGPGRHQRMLPLPVDDGVVGFLLVVRSRAGLGRREPRSGEVPEIRIEVDTTPPVVQLFAPVPDPQRANALVLCWTATDKNLGSHPVHLEWAERREGPWINIASNLANTGRHSWQLPESLPVQVYLRVRVRDLAGNEGIAATNEPQLVDLSEPVGRLLNVLTPGR